MDATSASSSAMFSPLRTLLISPHAPAAGDLSPDAARVRCQDANGIKDCQEKFGFVGLGPFASPRAMVGAWRRTPCSSTWWNGSHTRMAPLARRHRQDQARVFMMNTARFQPSPSWMPRVFMLNTPQKRGRCAPCRRIGCWSALPCLAGRGVSWPAGPDGIRPPSGAEQGAAVPSMATPPLGWNGWRGSTPHTLPRVAGQGVRRRPEHRRRPPCNDTVIPLPVAKP